jgi:phytoene/squalene synthetase
MKSIFDELSKNISATTTKRYSTSFSLGIRLLKHDLRAPIYALYGFVRFADEIVDSFHGHNKEELLAEFREDTYKAIERKISLNPILNSFQWAVHTYNIEHELIETFLESMRMDLQPASYDREAYEKYILGSAEVVGLMCLRVFTRGNNEAYEELKPAAMKLGSAFQKINFLRDYKMDNEELGRVYFPELQLTSLNCENKKAIEEDILKDFKAGFEGIKKLPKDARFGVYMAYCYYLKLFHKIQRMDAQVIRNERVRIPNGKKFRLIFTSYLRHNLNLL